MTFAAPNAAEPVLSSGAGSAGEGPVPGENPAEENIPPMLTVFVADEEIVSPEEQNESEVDSPTVLKASRIFLNPVVLAEIDAHEKPVNEMPIVRVEIFDDLIVDVEFVNAKPKWKPAEITYDEAGKPTNVEMVSDGTLIRGKLLEPHSGYIVLRTRSDGVSIGAVSVDGVGNIEIYRDGAPMHRAMLMEYPPLICGVDDDAGGEAPIDDSISFGAFSEFIELAEAALAGDCGEVDCPTTQCPSNGDCDDGCTIDVIVLYTEAARSFYESLSLDIQDIIVARFVAVNAIVQQSEISDDDLFRLVHVGEVDYDESGKSTLEAHSDLRDGFSPIFAPTHTMRNTLNADLVQLWVYGTSGVGGVGDGAFSTVREPYTPGTVAHELGHCFGLRHDRFQCTCVDCPTTQCSACSHCTCTESEFGYGWHFRTVDESQQQQNYETVMAYPTSLSEYPCCFPATQGAQYFSNPDVLFPLHNQPPTGSACANSALVVRGDESHFGARFTVARNRMSHVTADTTEPMVAIGAGPFYDETALNEDCESLSISANGQDLAFASAATNVPGVQKNNTMRDVYFFDIEAGSVKLVSHVSPNSETANGDSFSPAISGNRQFIALATTATDIVPEAQGITDAQILLYDRDRDPALISRASDVENETEPPTPGDLGNGPSDHPAVNYDGTQVAYESEATNLVGSDTNGKTDIFIAKAVTLEYDCTGDPPECEKADAIETVRISVSTSGTQADDHSYRPAISETGRFVAFESLATNLGDLDTQGKSNIWVRDRDTNDNGVFDQSTFVFTDQASRAYDHASNGIPDGDSFKPSISDNGRFTVFYSTATNLLDPIEWTIHGPPQNETYYNVYLYDREIGSVWLVSHNWDNLDESAKEQNKHVHISANGRWLVFLSDSDELDAGHTTTEWRVYIVRIVDDEGDLSFEIVRVIDDGEVTDYTPDSSTRPVVAGNGRFVAFDMAHTGTDPRQVFVHENAKVLGDLNGDGEVDEPDLLILLGQWGDCACCAGDLNGNGTVGVPDLTILTGNWTGESEP